MNDRACMLRFLTTLSLILEKNKAFGWQDGNFGIKNTSIFYPIWKDFVDE